MASKRPTLGRNVDIKPPSIPSNIETIYVINFLGDLLNIQ